LVTGDGDLDSAVKALRRGAYDFLLKPINPVILTNTVRKAVEHCRLKRFEKNHRLLLEDQVQSRTRELARTNEFLKGILDSSTAVAIVLTDFQHNVVFWNTGAEKIFGYSAEEMVGGSIRILRPVDTAQSETFENLSRMVQIKAGTIQRNVEQKSKDGRRLTICLTVSPRIDTSGRVSGILGLGQDVTEEVRLHEELVKSLQRIQKIQGASIFALAKLAESRDDETAFHLERLQAYCKALCRRLGLRKVYRARMTVQFVEDLVQCSVLHDIGKLAIPDSILFTPRKFGQDEREVMKQHAIKGGKALKEAADEVGEEASYLSVGTDVAYYHHEHWDGTGYPFGLEKDQIPLAARIVAVADVYDALTTKRRYKKAYSHDEAEELIAREKGKQFDPELVEAFLEIAEEFRHIRDELSGADSTEESSESGTATIP
jgi:PAS domain S-box-containing protein